MDIVTIESGLVIRQVPKGRVKKPSLY
jgi:hypothetical protein